MEIATQTRQICAWVGLIIYKRWMGDVGWPVLYLYTTFLSVSRGLRGRRSGCCCIIQQPGPFCFLLTNDMLSRLSGREAG